MGNFMETLNKSLIGDFPEHKCLNQKPRPTPNLIMPGSPARHPAGKGLIRASLIRIIIIVMLLRIWATWLSR